MFMQMLFGYLTPAATFLETGLAFLLAFSRVNAHFNLHTRMGEIARKFGGNEKTDFPLG